MDLLKRSLAPILPQAWDLIDAEAARVLRLNLAGRRIADFSGPHGWKLAAVNTGRLAPLPFTAIPDLTIGVRQVQPLVELRVPILLSLPELDTVARGGENPDLDAVVKAAEKVARAEDTAIFNGLPAAGIAGVIPSSPHKPIPIAGGIVGLPKSIVSAKEVLRQAGINGPYVLVLGTPLYDQVMAATEDGYPLAKRIEQRLVDQAIVQAPALDGGILMSARGGDYELTVGQDLSIGYAFHQRLEVELYLTESFTFRVLEAAAAVPLTVI